MSLNIEGLFQCLRSSEFYKGLSPLLRENFQNITEGMWGIGLYLKKWKTLDLAEEYTVGWARYNSSHPHSSSEGGANARESSLPTAMRLQTNKMNDAMMHTN